VERMACVNVRALPLQLLLARNPGWAAGPAVVVDRDQPLGLVLWANRLARTGRIVPGMRYAAALALTSALRGGVVPETEVVAAQTALLLRLWCFSPRIEPSPREPGIFWLDATGLRHLYPSLDGWAANIEADLRSAGFRALVAVGFSRFGAYAAAKAAVRTLVFHAPDEEHDHLARVSIERLGIDPALRDTLLELGVATLGEFAALPPDSIRQRLGAEADELHRLARGSGWMPLAPSPPLEPIEHAESFDSPEGDLDRLLGRIAHLLDLVLADLSARHEALAALRLHLRLDDHRQWHEDLSPAAPTREARQILQLLRLRLETRPLSAGVDTIKLCASGIREAQRQLDLFHEAPQGTLDSAQRAFANLRAKFGNHTVMAAQLHEGHLPEAQYAWEPLGRLASPRPAALATRPLARRIHTPPIELPSRDRHEPDGWLIAGVSEGPVEEVIGPQLVSGGWWTREISRAYYYVRTRSGRWLWIYHDTARRRWFLQGEVQ